MMAFRAKGMMIRMSSIKGPTFNMYAQVFVREVMVCWPGSQNAAIWLLWPFTAKQDDLDFTYSSAMQATAIWAHPSN